MALIYCMAIKSPSDATRIHVAQQYLGVSYDNKD